MKNKLSLDEVFIYLKRTKKRINELEKLKNNTRSNKREHKDLIRLISTNEEMITFLTSYAKEQYGKILEV